MGVRVTPQCDTINTFEICSLDLQQQHPVLAYGNGIFIAVWTDMRDTRNDLYAARIAPGGVVLDTNGYRISWDTLHYNLCPSITSNNTKHLAVWGRRQFSTNWVGGRFINFDGTLGDTIFVASASFIVTDTRITSDGTNFFVAWAEMFTSTWGSLHGQLVASDGSPIGNSFTIAPWVVHTGDRPFGLFYDGSHYLVTYCWDDTVYMQKYDTTGAQVDTVVLVSTTPVRKEACDIINNSSGRYLNVWRQQGNQFDIYGNLDMGPAVHEHRTKLPDWSVSASIVHEKIHITGSAGCALNLYDITGKKIGRISSKIYDCSSLATGIYIIMAENGYTQKVIKIE